MRFAGIDVGSETHVLAIVNEAGQALLKPMPFGEDAAGYGRLFQSVGSADDVVIAMEATGHYGRNLAGALADRGFAVTILNPLRTRRFAEEELRRAKTDSVDALGIARFAAQKRPGITPPSGRALDELRELVRLHERFGQDFGDRVRQLHRLVDLGFPEFVRHVRTLDSRLATTILRAYPTAEAFRATSAEQLAELRADGGRRVGLELARNLIAAAAASVGRHHDPAYGLGTRYVCDDVDVLRERLGTLAREIDRRLEALPLGGLLTTIEGIGPLTAARILAFAGNPAHFRSAAAFAAYVGVVPGDNRSGLRRPGQAPLSPLGHARLRKILWMPVLVAVKHNAWLRAYYQRLRAAGKKPKVALIAAMHKLLIAIYSVAKSGKPFVPRT